MERNKIEAKRIVDSVCASMRVEGFSVSRGTQQDCMDIAEGKKSASDMVKARLAEYKKK